MSETITCISDCHGAYYTLLRLLAQIPDAGQLICLGDTIDRGPHSRQVVEYMMANKVPTTIGNHCHMALYYHGRVDSSIYDSRDIWLHNGGVQALQSWGTWDTTRKLPDDVLDWMEGLPYYIERDGCLLSHTGHGKAKKARRGPFGLDEPREMLLWYRDTHFEKDGLYRVLGHTKNDQPIITDTWANIDTGAAYGGGLTAFQWPSKKTWYQPYDETPL